MATTFTSLHPLETTESVMRRIDRIDWMGWFEALTFEGPVELVPSRRTTVSWRLDRADYDPFDDVIELVLSDDLATFRLLIDGPSEILAVGTSSAIEHVTIIAEDGPLVVRSRRSGVRPTAG